MRLTRWMGVGLLLASGSLWAQSALVRTPSGVLAGLKQDGVAAYLGIPYAQPPVGALRWRAPQGGVVWDGIRPAVEYGPLCPQNLDIVVGPRPRVAEDCLTLNVWTPAGKPAHPLPVLVWLHGGGYFQGGASQWPTDGAALAARGAVVVSVNFRLGALGFFAHPALSAEAARDGSDDGTGVARSGNYGLLDQLAALAWVQATIARFGGDPGNVTLMGQSSGATTATALMASPAARGLFRRGLFHKVILMSGGVPAALRDLREPVGEWSSMEALGVSIARKLAIAEGDTLLALLRRMPWQGLDLAWRRALAAYKGDGTWHHLIVDGDTLVTPPGAVFAQGRQAALPMLTGGTADEGSWFARRAGLGSRRALAGYVREVYGEALAPSVLKRHAPQRGKPADWLAASSRLITAQFRETLHATARAQRRLTPQVYAYEFRRSRIPPGERVALGDYHSAELPYVFDRLPPELAADAYHAALADELAARWVAFARHGTPNPPGLPAWVAYPASPDEHRAATALNRAGLAKPAATNPACTPPSCAAEP